MNPKVDIVMSVFNGQMHLEKMLTSLENQSYPNWNLICRNNFSNDSTDEILSSFRKKNNNKVQILKNTKKTDCIPKSFGQALKKSKAKYIMFADSDDIWLKNKIKNSVKMICAMEKRFGEKKALLAHSDLIIIDEHEKILSNSMWRSQKLNVYNKTLRQAIFLNSACGNTFIFNSVLKRLALPITSNCQMHDRWIFAIACAFGNVSIMRRPEILYRQHSENTCGGVSNFLMYALDRALNPDKIRSGFKSRSILAQELLLRFNLRSKDKEFCKNIIRLQNLNFLQKRVLLFRQSLFFESFARNLGLLLYI